MITECFILILGILDHFRHFKINLQMYFEADRNPLEMDDRTLDKDLYFGLSQAFNQAVQIIIAVKFDFHLTPLAALFDHDFGAEMA